jgi:thiol-disulfide isomerase/thioredoxin
MKRQILTVIACAICVSALVSWSLSRQDKPAGAHERTVQDINMDLRAQSNQIRGALADEDALFNPAKRQQQASKVVPAIKKMLVLFDELAKVEPAAKEQAEEEKLDFTTILVLFGDADAKSALEKQASGGDDKAAAAQGALLIARWWHVGTDPAAQGKLLDEVEQLAKSKPQSDALATALVKMSKVGASNEALAERARDIIINDLTGEAAKQIADEIKAERKLRQMVGKPIEIAGRTVDGKPFTSKDWKGKVILVDFWATWCAPCVKALPRIKRVYKDYHDKGLEIVGVSWDDNHSKLKEFLANDPEMVWPQLYSEETVKLDKHPLAKELGVVMIPAMFLIDRQGVLRSYTADEDFEDAIPKMLEEKGK